MQPESSGITASAASTWTMRLRMSVAVDDRRLGGVDEPEDREDLLVGVGQRRDPAVPRRRLRPRVAPREEEEDLLVRRRAHLAAELRLLEILVEGRLDVGVEAAGQGQRGEGQQARERT